MEEAELEVVEEAEPEEVVFLRTSSLRASPLPAGESTSCRVEHADDKQTSG